MRYPDKKILFIINSLKFGGAENIFFNLFNEFSERGINVEFGLIYGKSQEGEGGFNLEKAHFFDFKNLFNFKKYFQLRRFIIKNKIDVIFSTLEDSNIVARVMGILLPKVKIIIRESNIADKKIFKFKILDILLNFFCDNIIAVSSRVKKSLIFYQGFHKNKIVVIKNGIKIPKERKIDYRKKHDLLKILNVANLKKSKGQIYLLEAFNDLVKDLDNLKLSIVGEGPLRHEFEDFIRNNAIGEKVELSGYINKKNLPNKYLEADIFVLSSLWEGCPNVLLEAMSYGLPVVSTRVSGSEDIIEDGISGLMIEAANTREMRQALKRLVKDENLRNFLGERARMRIKNNYNLKKMSNEYLSLI